MSPLSLAPVQVEDQHSQSCRPDWPCAARSSPYNTGHHLSPMWKPWKFTQTIYKPYTNIAVYRSFHKFQWEQNGTNDLPTSILIHFLRSTRRGPTIPELPTIKAPDLKLNTSFYFMAGNLNIGCEKTV